MKKTVACAVCALEKEMNDQLAPITWIALDVRGSGWLYVCGLCVLNALSDAIGERLAQLHSNRPTE